MNTQHIKLEEIDSTNEYLLNLAANNMVIPWSVVSTEYQTKGRGQRNNSWYSSKAKNLLCSIFLKPIMLLPKDQFNLNVILSMAVFNTVNEIIGTDRTKIKWPNDIYVDNHKVGGLLIQNTLQGQSITQSILGIGLNINEKEFPPELVGASSLLLKTGIEKDTLSILSRIIECLKFYYTELCNGNYQVLLEEYTQNLYRLQEDRPYLDKNDIPFTGKIIGVNSIGQLMIDVEGQIKFYSMKEVKFCA